VLIAFRVDASDLIGTGHVMRCLTLAERLAEQGAWILFMARYMPQFLIDAITAKGFAFKLLTNKSSVANLNKLKHSHWLGTSQDKDAEDTIQALKMILGEEVLLDWLIVDHYALDSQWEISLRNRVKKIMVIDDIADRNHDCDILLDQNLFENMATRYIGKTKSECNLLLGPKFALLQSEYAKIHNQKLIKTKPVKRIFLYYGGVDDTNLTGLTIDAFLALNRCDITLDVVISPTNVYTSSLNHQISSNKNINLHIGLPSLASLMQQADLAIGAGGATTWERLCLALPSIVVTVAENQIMITNSLAEAGLVCYIGNKNDITKKLLICKLQNVLSKPSLAEWSSNCFEACDGKGVSRVVENILALNG
jgi:UDP-2,4-diacetamido-2,4,6-trideoxy-beta-L-altropyranose hydrolase